MKRLLIIISFFTILTLPSCSEEKSIEPPSNLVEEELFIDLMVDIHLLESAQNQKMFRNDNSKEQLKSKYTQIFEKHKVQVADFDSTYQFYYKQPERMILIYESMLEKLSKQEALLNDQ